MRNKLWLFCLLFVLAMPSPTWSVAPISPPSSSDTPNDKPNGGAGGTCATLFPVQCAGAPSVNVPSSISPAVRSMVYNIVFTQNQGSSFNYNLLTIPAITETACQFGAAVAINGANRLCNRALALGAPWVVPGGCAGVPAQPTACTAPSVGSPVSFFIQRTDLTPQCGFKVTYDPTNVGGAGDLPRVRIDDDPPCHVTSFYMGSNAANTVMPDLNRQFNLQLQVNGNERDCVGGTNPGTACTSNSALCTGGGVCTDTIVRWRYKPIGGSVATLANVNLASFINQTDQAEQALGNQLLAVLSPSAKIYLVPNFSNDAFPAGYSSSVPVLIAVDANLTLEALGIEVVQGGNGDTFQIAQETSDLTVVPALSTWGAAAVVAALLLSSLWLLRRKNLVARP